MYFQYCKSNYERYRIIAINDGSTDNSLNILDSLSLRYKGKLKIINKENGGTGSARNIGIEYSNGEFIKFVDADDYLDLDVLDKMYDVAHKNNVKLVRGNYRTIVGPFKTTDKCSFSDINGSKIIYVKNKKDYIVTETPGIGNKLIHRTLLEDLRFLERTKWEDLSIIPIVVARSDKIFHMDSEVYNYRVNLNTTVKDFINKIPNILDIIKCLENIEVKMNAFGLYDEYKKQIRSLYILHTLFRIENVMTWVNFKKI